MDTIKIVNFHKDHILESHIEARSYLIFSVILVLQQKT